VVDKATPLLTKALKKSFGINPLNVNYKLKTGLKFCIKNPDKLGADRIANAAAAYKLYKGYSIVIDFGTATTFSVVSSSGEYRGGAIMPGLGISAQVLSDKTARLPRVELKAPDKALGDDTESNILSGLIIGHAGAVERIVKEIKLSIKKNKKAGTCTNVIITGGSADIVAPYIRGRKKINPFLTLEGLRIIYGLNV
jgi:type III pantothenate kinase